MTSSAASAELVCMEHVTVTMTVLGVEQVRNRGPLIGLAIVELDIAGVIITLQGVQLLRLPDGSLACRSRSFGAQTEPGRLPPSCPLILRKHWELK